MPSLRLLVVASLAAAVAFAHLPEIEKRQASNCTDTLATCPDYKRMNLCSGVLKQCPKSCNACGIDFDCKDTSHPTACAYIKLRGQCANSSSAAGCRKTCGLCKVKREAEDFPESSEIIEKRAVCADYHGSAACAKIKARGDCTDSNPVGTLNRKGYCAKTCGLCKAKREAEDFPVSEEKTEKRAVCTDYHGSAACAKTKARGDCTDSNPVGTLNRKGYCAKTCGLCKAKRDAEDFPVSEEIVEKRAACRDFNAGCALIKASDCTTNAAGLNIKLYCAKTCGLCKA